MRLHLAAGALPFLLGIVTALPLGAELGLGGWTQGSSGSYGGEQTVAMWDVGVEGWWQQGGWRLQASLPFVSSDPGAPVRGGAGPIPGRGAPGGGSPGEPDPGGPGPGPGPGGGGGGGGDGELPEPDPGRRSGIGDFRLRLDRSLPLTLGPVRTGLSFELKVPLADETEGLGTGELDASGGAVLWSRPGRWSFYCELAHWWIGDPPGVALENAWRGTLSAGRDLGSKSWHLAALARGNSETLAGVGAGTEIGLWLLRRLPSGQRFDLTATAGFGDGAPDVLISLGWRSGSLGSW